MLPGFKNIQTKLIQPWEKDNNTFVWPPNVSYEYLSQLPLAAGHSSSISPRITIFLDRSATSPLSSTTSSTISPQCMYLRAADNINACLIGNLNTPIISLKTMLAWYSWTSITRPPLGPWKFVRDVGSSSHWGLIMKPGQEANGDNLGNVFDLRDKNYMLSVLIRIASSDEYTRHTISW